MRPRALVVGFGAITVGALLWFRLFDHHEPLPTAPPEASDKAPAPDFFVTGMRATATGPDGRPARTLRLQRMQHFSDNQTTELSAPQLTVYQDEQPPWEITAERGWLSAGGEWVLLQGDVEMARQGDATTRPVCLQTRNLKIKLARDYAETNEPVSIVSLEDRVEAVGMQAWLRNPTRLKLLSKARGYYVPD